MRKKAKDSLCWILLLLPLLSVAKIETAEYSCPLSIQTSQTSDSKLDPWKIVSDKGTPGFFFFSVGLYAQHPDNNAALVPNTTYTKTETERKSNWRLSSEEEYWIACAYLNTNLLAIQKLPVGIKSCEVTDLKSSSGKFKSSAKVICQV